MQKQEALLCQLYPFDGNDAAIHKKNLSKFDLDIYVRVKERYHKQTATLLSFQNCQKHADISSNAWDMAIYVKMTFT